MNARALVRICGLVALFFASAPPHLLSKLLFGSSRWPRRFLATAARIAGARVRLQGEAVRAHSLLLSNHLSWLDILILGGATGCAFVSKDDLGHPLVHWLADQNRTVYVRRSDVRGARDQALSIARALERDRPVTVFPEGTTGPGDGLRPFRSTLLQAATLASKEVCIRPVALDYEAACEIAWFEEPALANVFRVLGRKGGVKVTVRLLDPLDRALDRKKLAAAAQAAIASALGFKSAEHAPIGGGS